MEFQNEKKHIFSEVLNSTNAIELSVHFPKQCPICHDSGSQNFLISYSKFLDMPIPAIRNFSSTLLFHCPSCEGIFIEYIPKMQESGLASVFSAANPSEILFFPTVFKPTEFSDRLNNVSPDFVSIYNESSQAEHQGLLKIAGVGYRKSFEFLVKDYLINHLYISDEPKKESVKNKTLGQCIDQDIDYKKLQILAKKASWLGNDETHYIKEFKNADLSDLKNLIDLSVKYIDMELEADEIENNPDYQRPSK